MNSQYPGQPKKNVPLNTGLLVSVGSQVGLAIIAIILVALLVGLGIDELLETEKHPFTIILFLGSVPFSLIATYYLATRTSKQLNSQGPEEKPGQPVQEEGKRE